MPKMKTNSSAKKRFKLTGSGKVKRAHAYVAHNLRKRSKKVKLSLSGTTTVKPADEKRMKKLLCKA